MEAATHRCAAEETLLIFFSKIFEKYLRMSSATANSLHLYQKLTFSRVFFQDFLKTFSMT